MYFNDPFDHWILDDFLDKELAEKLSNDFLDYDSDKWYVYNNPLENKKTLNNYFDFPSTTYKVVSYLNSPQFINYLSNLTGINNLYPDIGLHGAGWHIHGRGGKLNVHFDYNIHPKLDLQRKLNIIIYLTKDWDVSWGGNLEFWSHSTNTNKPNKKIKIIDNVFNRAVVFDTTQNSWHGFPQELTCPPNVYRKSLAMYYLCDPPKDTDQRKRALYSPTDQQVNNREIEELIKKRSQ